MNDIENWLRKEEGRMKQKSGEGSRMRMEEEREEREREIPGDEGATR